MRILQIRFKNLNSLVGEWEIDLMHASYAADGIFAITGPTGAGKSTILDAICLALYGRTARLGKITKTSNELMSRQCGECFAEVNFETQAGRYRCHFSQHRARKKPQGELQAPKHEISYADSGKIVETSMRGVSEQIEAVTGMNFEQFTRSMLLAQGGFAAFLQASADERAPLLEQITGTDLYSRLSMHVHERRSQAQKALDTLEAGLAGIPFFSEATAEQLKAKVVEAQEKEQIMSRHLVAHNAAISWREKLSHLEFDLQQIDRDEVILQEEQQDFAPQLERLQLAGKALELAGDYAALQAIRQEAEKEQKDIKRCREDIQATSAVHGQATARAEKAALIFEQLKSEESTALPLLRKARELDLIREGKDELVQGAQNFLSEQKTAFNEQSKKQDKDLAALAEAEKTLAQVAAYLLSAAADASLVEDLAGLRNRFEALREHELSLNKKKQEAVEAAQKQDLLTAEWQRATVKQIEEQAQLSQAQAAYVGQKAQLEQIVKKRQLADWRKEQQFLALQKDLTEKALGFCKGVANSQQVLLDLAKKQAVIDKEVESLGETLSQQRHIHAAKEREYALLEEQVRLLQKISDLEAERHQLQDGTPCPLCGAKQHPYAEGNLPANEASQERLLALRGELSQAKDNLTAMQVRLAEQRKDMEQLSTRQEEQGRYLVEQHQLLEEALTQLPAEMDLSLANLFLVEGLQGHLRRLTAQLAQIVKVIEQAEFVERELTQCRQRVETSKSVLDLAERVLLTALMKKDAQIQLVNRMLGQLLEEKQQQKELLALLFEDLKPYRAPGDVWEANETHKTPLTVQGLAEFFYTLAARRQQWLAKEKEQQELARSIAVLRTQTRQQAEALKDHEKRQMDLQKQLAVLVQERKALQQERFLLLADKSPDAEEKRLADAVESAGKKRDITRQKAEEAKQRLHQLSLQVKDLEEKHQGRLEHIKEAEKALHPRLHEHGFSSEESYLVACLAEGERNKLTEQARKFTEKELALVAKKREKIKELAEEREKNLSAAPLESLKAGLAEFIEGQKQLQQEIGGMQQKLKDNESMVEQHCQQVQAINAQKIEWLRWNQLHELIGSADGKKYRNFVQELTFEMLVAQANRQFKKMSDRYLLRRNEQQGLELDVIDNYQAGEIRSTKNLSGGESFLVSLALALGLSQLASQTIRIDSLFLDEGFGTLDDEALETALATLAGLNEEGKLIGIISHVPALKERISVQIQVVPQMGGKSRLIGPGVSRADLGLS